jgi:eukaryotic-like serine/threonine-protein kinase
MASDAQIAERKPAAGGRSAAARSAAGGRQVVLQDRFTIFPDRPYPELATAETPAVVAEDPMTPGEIRAALICDVDPLPRIEVMDKLKALARPGLTQIAAFGAVDWPGSEGERLAVVINPPQGGRLVPAGAVKFAPMAPEVLVDQVIRPVVTGLTEMFHRNQTHRGIRPDNLFFSDATRTRIVLGQAVTAPAGYYQTPGFETLECSTADPAGKGGGTRAEDMFSLGATLLSLLIGRVPGADMDEDDFYAQRVEKGSLDACIDPRELPRDMIDGLRGLMADDARERWTLEHLKGWLEGNRVTAPRSYATVRAHQGFDFGGKKYWTAPALAFAMSRKRDAAAKALRSGGVFDWMKKSLPDNTATDALGTVIAEADMAGGAGDDLLIARASVAMDPAAPIRFSGYSTRLDGIGPMLVSAQRKPGGLAAMTEMLKANLPSYWLSSQPKHVSRGVGLNAHLEKLGRWVTDASPGAGIERCLYDLNPNLPCRSPITGGRWVSDPSQLLPAIDKVAAAGGIGRQPIDRHIAAFLASRSHADTTQLLGLMQPTTVDDHSAIGTLRLLAELQQSFKSKPLPGLGNWCADLLKPVIETFHHRKRRAKLLEVTMGVARSGNLPALLKLIDDAQFKKVDRSGFEKAKERWSRAEKDLADMEKNNAKRIDEARRTGREAAAIISSGMAVLTVGIMLMMKWL